MAKTKYKDRLIYKLKDASLKLSKRKERSVNLFNELRTVAIKPELFSFKTEFNAEDLTPEKVDEYHNVLRKKELKPIVDEFSDHYMFKENKSVNEAVEELDLYKNTFWLPRKVDSERNAKIGELNKLVPMHFKYKSRGILYPDNFVTALAYVAPLMTKVALWMDSALYNPSPKDLIVNYVCFGLSALFLAGGVADIFRGNSSDDVFVESNLKKNATYVDNIVKEVSK